MASSATQKSLCITCGKGSRCFTCQGCGKDFCKQHVVEHQQQLGKQLEDLIIDHDQLRENLNQHTQQELQYKLYTNKIDEWEEECINKIHQIAHDARQELQNLITQHSTKLNQSLSDIATELRTAHGDDDFHEVDLSKWIEKLNQLKLDIAQPPCFEIKLENSNIIPFIPKVKISKTPNEFFGESRGNIKIENFGQVLITESTNGFGTARSIHQFSSGKHQFRFKMEFNGSDKWVFMGIISQNEPISQISWNNKSSYGWSGDNRVYIDGVYQISSQDEKIDLENNDIVELLIDCDQNRIQLTNERTRNVSTIAIDKDKCRLPWQINFNLYHANDRISFLSN